MADFTSNTSCYWYGSTFTNNGLNHLGSAGGPGAATNYLRFPGVTIPRGSSIVSAVISFTAYNSVSSTSPNLTIKGDGADDSVAPTSVAEGSALVATVETVSWSGLSAWVTDQSYETPDFSAVVQEITDRAGWESGNALGIIISDSDGSMGYYRTAKGGAWASGKPVLSVTYTDLFDKTITENFTIDDTVSGSLLAQKDISDGFTIDDVVDGARTIDKDVADGFTIDDAVDAELLGASRVLGNFTVNDTVDAAGQYSAGIGETIGVHDIVDATLNNPLRRRQIPIKITGGHLTLRFRNNGATQSLQVIDGGFKIGKYVGMTRSKATQIKVTGGHIRLRFQNSVAGEELKLDYMGTKIDGYRAR